MRRLLCALGALLAFSAWGTDYYAASGNPATGAALSSAVMRAEFTLIAAGFAKIAGYTGNANKLLAINAGATAQTAITTGTGVLTALGVNVGSAGAFVVNGGALGSPSSAGTIPAFTLGGTVSGGGNQINNVAIGTSNPGIGYFTVIRESTGEAWTDWTPTLTADTGTYGALTVTLARYRLIGKTLLVHLLVSASVTSGSPTEFRLSFPNGASGKNANLYAPSGLTINSTSETLSTARQTTSTYFSILRNGGAAFTGAVQVNGFYIFEIA